MDQLPPRWHLNGSLHGISPNFLGRAGCNPGAASFPADWLDPSRGWRRVMLRRNRVRIPGLRPGSPTDQVDGLPSLNLWSPPSSTNASTSEIGTEGVCQVQTCEQELLRERVAVWQLLERLWPPSSQIVTQREQQRPSVFHSRAAKDGHDTPYSLFRSSRK